MASVDDIPALVRRLRSGSRVAQSQAARALARLAETDQGDAAAIVAAGGLPPLLHLLTSGSNTVQEAAAEAFIQTASDEHAAAVAVAARTSGLNTAALKQLLTESPSSLVVCAAAVVAGMVAAATQSKGRENSHRLSELVAAGLVSPLLGLLPDRQDDNEQAMQIADTAALQALALADDGATAIESGGGIPQFVRMLGHAEFALRLNACLALRALAYERDDMSRLIAACGAVAPLLTFLLNSASGSHDGNKAQRAAKVAGQTLALLCEASTDACSEVEASGTVPQLESIAHQATGDFHVAISALLTAVRR